jgi:hypothetical protein
VTLAIRLLKICNCFANIPLYNFKNNMASVRNIHRAFNFRVTAAPDRSSVLW